MAEKKKRATKKPVVAPAVAPVMVEAVAPVTPPYEAVAQRAYELWKARGGSAFENWIAAEKELS